MVPRVITLPIADMVSHVMIAVVKAVVKVNRIIVLAQTPIRVLAMPQAVPTAIAITAVLAVHHAALVAAMNHVVLHHVTVQHNQDQAHHETVLHVPVLALLVQVQVQARNAARQV